MKPVHLCGWFLPLAMAAAGQAQSPGGGSETVQDCIRLTDDFDPGDALERLLAVELHERGISISDEGDRHCLPVHVDEVSEQVAVVELPEGRSRVVDLTPIAPDLRLRSLALAVAEELHAVHADAPQLQPAPQPSQPEPPPQQVVEARVETVATPAPATPSVHPVELVIGGMLEYFPTDSQTLGGGRLGIVVHPDAEVAGRLRFGLQGLFGEGEAGALGSFDARVFSGWVAWDWPVANWESGSFRVIPELGVGVVWLRGRANASAVLASEDTASFYLRVSLAAALRLAITDGFAVELGPYVGVVPVPVEVLGDDESVAGASGFMFGGQLSGVIRL